MTASKTPDRNLTHFLPGDDAAQPGLSRYADRVEGSTILRIAAEIRAMQGRGEQVLNLTVGDFRPDQFPVPEALVDYIVEALHDGETNYPPVDGVPELREQIRVLNRDDLGLEYPMESVLVAGGARPLIYSTYMAVVDPEDCVLYPVPSWNNHHYAYLSGANATALPVSPDRNFHLDAEAIEPWIQRARLLCLNSPLNPTGTCISESALGGISEAIVRENSRREAIGQRPLYVVYDQVYRTLTYGDSRHHTPVGLVPEMAPYTVLVDAVSKAMSGTGLRVGWAAGPPHLIAKMREMAGHYGAWAPRAEQVATARFLKDRTALSAHRVSFIGQLHDRLDRIHLALGDMATAGCPVEHIPPQGAIYLSVRFDLVGKRVAGRDIRTNEDIRRLLLEEAGLGVLPFQAFGMEGDTGWMRISVGAVSPSEIDAGMVRLRDVLTRVE
ncbi:MAG: aminotransferase class I/II-fold pyridoxal phosphate-dependent enzyme [Gemmatimonadota bacterium]|jgi:aspartate aminotransferase|nr:aminotransferase class I/II-fold pyridoxal phosphate-dependent enzyme [Gemmatimonadota bacterium]MDP6802217.1 aminotransferase class I/II-fold pyridoxal phosphate-dependent enzyme [Gemmatimonadota bacterium]MDP7032138.1 aminotransferase class I/II-fold pyridoxal phosphate-dependent enzyme [Gemmatimonadota bacterium]